MKVLVHPLVAEVIPLDETHVLSEAIHVVEEAPRHGCPSVVVETFRRRRERGGDVLAVAESTLGLQKESLITFGKSQPGHSK